MINIDNEYEKDIFPLVSILIPTYNRVDYFEIALESALSQTYKNIEIIISDNSEGNETENLIKNKYLSNYKNIRYYKNNTNIGASASISRLLELSKGDYINYLMDDDVFEKTKIEKMMNYFINDKYNEISMVTSTRYIINDFGEKQRLFFALPEVIKIEHVFEGSELLKFVFNNKLNIIGEPTTVLFKKDKLEEKFGVYKGYLYVANMDLASWFNLLNKGKCVFVVEPLSMFRMHSQQGGQNSSIIAIGAREWENFAKDLQGQY